MVDDATLTFTFACICFGAAAAAFWGAKTSQYHEERLGLVCCGLWLAGTGIWILL